MNKRLERLLKEADNLAKMSARKFSNRIKEIYQKVLEEIDAELQDFFLMFNGTPTLEEINKYSRLKKFEKKIEIILNDARVSAKSEIGGAVSQSLDDGYYAHSYAYFNTFRDGGIAIKYKLLDPNVVKMSENATREEITGYIFKNKVNGQWVWDNSLKTNHAKAFQRINTEIKQGILQGKGYAKTSREIKKVLFNNQKRQFNLNRAIQNIVSTETGKARSLASLMSYNDLKNDSNAAGVKIQRLWLATLDNRVRDNHLSLHNQPEDDKGMWNVNGSPAEAPRLTGNPSEDINCRCTTVTKVEGLETKVDETKKAHQKLNPEKLAIWKSTLK